MIGTIFGEVVLLRNAGSQGAPSFPEMTTLVELLPGDAGAKQIKRVPFEDGAPVAPGCLGNTLDPIRVSANLTSNVIFQRILFTAGEKY